MESGSLQQRLDSLPRERASLLPALLIAQHREGFVSDEAVETVARHVRLSANEVEGVATAYPELRRSAPAMPLMRVCMGEACRCAGAAAVMDALRRDHRAKDVELEEVPCFFLCGVGPVVEIGGERVGRVTPGRVDELLTRAERAR